MTVRLRPLTALVAVCLVLMATLACTDDMEYSRDPRHTLTFSHDTIAFDTLFTHVGSSTAAFKVLNKTSAHLLLSDVRLAGGWQSPFRVNVDGRYDTRWTDVEVRAGDSIWVFVEATLPDTDGDYIYATRDSLLFTLASGVSQKVLLTASGWNAIELRGVTLRDDTTLLGSRAYVIFDSLVVAAGHTLTVEPGTVLCFHDRASLLVDGTVHAAGTLDEPIVWRGDRLDYLLTSLPYDRVDGQWGGIALRRGSTGNVFTHCDIHSSSFGIRAEGDSLLTLENTTIHNTSLHGLQLTLTSGHAYNCQFTNAGGHCATLLGGTFDFLHCTFANFYWRYGQGAALDIANMRGDTLFPLAVTFTNCIVTGRGADELSGQVVEVRDSTGAVTSSADYLFSHSLLNTPRVENDHYRHITWESPDSTVWGAMHFVNATNIYQGCDFRLLPLSTARGIGTDAFLTLCPLDKLGTARTDTIDAGCYQLPRNGQAEEE
ncbi:MAG: right-handed parallel beta-helix repeat-containing protein [Bacteroidaceae bacterium]|nr:right-handed parallel beta-helix repeat-containing protein [Bacteroidaceae bacterium]